MQRLFKIYTIKHSISYSLHTFLMVCDQNSATIQHIRQRIYRSTLSAIGCRTVDKNVPVRKSL